MQQLSEELSEKPGEERAAPPTGPAGSTVGGAFVVVCAAAAAAFLELPDVLVTTNEPRLGWLYPAVMWPLLLVMAAAGVAMMRPARAGQAAVVAAIVSALVATNGLATLHKWFMSYGFGDRDGEGENLIALHAFAAYVVIAAVAATAVSAAVVWRERAFGRYGLLPARPAFVVAGAAVTFLLPLVQATPRVSLVSYVIWVVATPTYALPWGAGLAAAGWLRPGPARTAVVVTVVVSALACLAVMIGDGAYQQWITPPD